MRIIARHVAVLYLSMTALLGVPVSAGVIVLCISPNGHVAIEPGDGRCADTFLGSAESITGPVMSIAPVNCGPCVDFPFGPFSLRDARRTTDTSSTLVPSLTLHADGGSLILTTPPARSAIFSSASASRTSFPPARTTILRN